MAACLPNRAGALAVWSDFCAVSPSPELRERLQEEQQRIRSASALASQFVVSGSPHPLGFDDGTIIPPGEFPVGTPRADIAAAAAERRPLTGAVRVVVVLADFGDKPMARDKQQFEKLFFSLGAMPNGSVREYYREVTHGLVDIVGEVVGPVRLPKDLSWYANGNFGIGKPSGQPRAHLMARDTAIAADPQINYAPYDNDGNGFVDAFIVVHAGAGGEVSGDPGDIWSHKWTLPDAYNADGSRIFAYLTIPEDARIGVCAHELGHLLFGFPDLYDIDGTSEGVGNWCLMGGGSWGGDGDVPTHPSAWCKIDQGWATVSNVTGSTTLSIPDVKNSHQVHRMWTGGLPGSEYFLVENRQRTGYDVSLPGDGLLIWHVDEHQPDNSDETHYMVGLVQADDRQDLEWSANRGDTGDPYPGSTGNTAFGPTSAPGSHSHSGAPTGVSVTGISASGPTMTATVAVTVPGPVHVPVGVAAARAEVDSEAGLTGLTDMIHAFQSRLEILEQAVAGDVRRSAEPALEGGARQEHDGAPGAVEPTTSVGHSYRRR
ncbi:M6 family metalloprotease domain-containing protein [Streptomyces spongiae]|uniref:M6 family metalloprotease domain-containing protein n=1 Tax=Streptomyces spongiae TaxID=565072 RepID=A0A5N8XQB3_9ACTN|nr:M6 family metalloprotease domain-containing protein [Streptomyces spongiae]MPY61158.1 M6 family metalloprotease domain-containing protein [Streptomyces spongiae]